MSRRYLQHRGGKRPVGHDVLVDIQLRDGTEYFNKRAGDLNWQHFGPDRDDITGWRLSFPQRRTIWQRIASIFKRKDTQ